MARRAASVAPTRSETPPIAPRAVLEFAALDLRELGARAGAAAVASYGWDRTFSELVGVYRSLLSEPPSATRAISTPPSAAPRISA